MNRIVEEWNTLSKIKPVLLIIVPNAGELATLSGLAREAGYVHQAVARNIPDASYILARKSIAMILADYEDTTWTKILQLTRFKRPAPRLTLGLRFSQLGSLDCEMVLKAGVYNVLARPYRASEVRQALGFACQAWSRESALTTERVHPVNRNLAQLRLAANTFKEAEEHELIHV